MSSTAHIWQTLLCTQRIGSPKSLSPTYLEAQLDLEGPRPKDQEQVCILLFLTPRRGLYHVLPTLMPTTLGSRNGWECIFRALSPSGGIWNNASLPLQLNIQLAQLSEWLEQLVSQAEARGQAAAPMVPIQEWHLSPSTPGLSGVWPGGGGTPEVGASLVRVRQSPRPSSQVVMSVLSCAAGRAGNPERVLVRNSGAGRWAEGHMGASPVDSMWPSRASSHQEGAEARGWRLGPSPAGTLEVWGKEGVTPEFLRRKG